MLTRRGKDADERRKPKRRKQGAFLALVLLATFFAGCLGEGDITPVAPSDLDESVVDAHNKTAAVDVTTLTQIETELGASMEIGNATRDDWFVMAGASGPEGNVTGFEWTVPEGAVVDRYAGPLCPTCSGTTMRLEMAPLVPSGADRDGIDQFILAVFRTDDEGASLVSYYTRGWWSEESLFVYQATYESAHLDPFYFRVGIDEVAPGDTLHFLVVADSVVPGEFGFAFSVLPEDIGCSPVEGCGPGPSPDFETFKAARSTDTPYALPRTGAGSGYSYPSFYDGHFAGLHYTGWSRDVDVSWGLPKEVRYTGLYDVTTSFDFPAERGWGIGYAYVSFIQNGEWSYQYSIHGDEATESGVAVAGCSLLEVSCSLDGYAVESEGEGPSAASFHVRSFDPGPLFGVGLEHLEIGVTLEELFGVPPKAESASEAVANIMRERAAAGGWPIPQEAHQRFPAERTG